MVVSVKKIIFLVLLIGIVLIGFYTIQYFTPASNMEQPGYKAVLKYDISGCIQKTEGLTKSVVPTEKPNITVENNSIIFFHHVIHNCCKNITLNYTQKGNVINITELHKGEICRCICDSYIDALLGPLELGIYEINVHSFDKDYSPDYQLIHSEQVTIR